MRDTVIDKPPVLSKEDPLTLARYIPTGEIRHIKDVLNGLACDCQCDKCEERLEAIQGASNVWHFRHNGNKKCDGGKETALHKFAKQIIKRSNTIKISEVESFGYEKSLIEEPLGGFTIDAIVENENKKLIVEVAVTHFMEVRKEEFIRSSKIKAVEIDLSKVSRQIEEKELERILIHECALKRVIEYEEGGEVKKEVETSDDSNFWIWAAILVFIGWLLGRNKNESDSS
jgi:hypothetical protein